MTTSPTTSEAAFTAFETQRAAVMNRRWRMSPGRSARAVSKVFIRLLRRVGGAGTRQPFHPVPRPCPLPPPPICNLSGFVGEALEAAGSTSIDRSIMGVRRLSAERVDFALICTAL